MSKQDNFDRFPFILADDDSDALPAWLDGLVTVFEKTTVGVRKATR